MSNLTIQDDKAKISEGELIEVLATSLFVGASINAIKMVLGYCKAAGLDPLQKPVHIVPMWDSKSKMMRDVIMPGIGLYRTQAARSGCAGVNAPEFGPDVTATLDGQEITFPAWCKVTVKRRLLSGEVVEFTAKEFWRENYASKGGQAKSIAPNAMWSKRPYGQLAKCAEAQALRKAFPEIGSQQTADEMEGKTINDCDSQPLVIEHTKEYEDYMAFKQEAFTQMMSVAKRGHDALVKEFARVYSVDALNEQPEKKELKYRFWKEHGEEIKEAAMKSDRDRVNEMAAEDDE